MKVVPTNEAGWMNTDRIVCTHGNSQICLREKVVRRSCVMTQVKAVMQVSDQHSIPHLVAEAWDSKMVEKATANHCPKLTDSLKLAYSMQHF